MMQISKAALKKAIVAVESERARQPVAFQPDRTQLSVLQKSRKASDKAVSGFLSQAGLNLKAFQTLQGERSAVLDQFVAQQKADALRRAAKQKGTLHSSIVAQSKALKGLASLGDFFPYPSFNLDTPFLIWTTPLGPISDSAAVPFGSFAKFKVKASRYQGTQKIGFYFYWANPFSNYAVINATTFMSATGHLKAHAPWTVGVNTSRVAARAQFGLWYGFPGDVASTDYESAFLGDIGAFGSTFTGGSTRGVSISAGVSLNKTMFPVPPGKVVVFEVALFVDYENDDGNIEADFETGAFKITCPVVVFSLLNMPPGAMA